MVMLAGVFSRVRRRVRVAERTGCPWACRCMSEGLGLAAWKAIEADAPTTHVLKHGVPVEFLGL